MCGCKSSTEINGELMNEDVDVKHRFLTGIHFSKDLNGMEGNVQIALGTVRKKKYERVPLLVNNSQTTTEDLEGNSQGNSQSVVENLESN